MTHPLTAPMSLPCGAVLLNRLAKASTSEGLADVDNHSTPQLETLYRRWSASGAGLVFTGNIQVDRWHLERPGNVVVDDATGRCPLARLAAAGQIGGNHFWAQLSHTGRQVSSRINTAPLSASDVEIDVIRGSGYHFATPKPMTGAEIGRVVEQFAFSAGEVKTAGFSGVALHAAHGYLFSQFLSPLSNLRTDRWGGSLPNRARLLIDSIAAVRETVGPDFPIGIKLNTSDFQKGGFSHAECVELVKMLNGTSLDLLELSGGSLEQPKVVGISVKDQGEDGIRASSVLREAYFVTLAGAVRQVAAMPVMVTGGFRSGSAMTAALSADELDIVGVARPLIADPQSAGRLLDGQIDRLPTPETSTSLLHILPWNNIQIERLAAGLDPDLSLSGADAARTFEAAETDRAENLLAHRNRCGMRATATSVW